MHVFHKWEIVTWAHAKDFRNDFSSKGGRPWGEPVTVFTLRCERCGKLKTQRVEGWQHNQPNKENKHEINNQRNQST